MLPRQTQLLLLAAVLAALQLAPTADGAYTLGVGIADVTGPPAEITFMGYAQMSQRGRGLHLRQFSRAFIIDDGSQRFVFVSVDCGMIGTGLRREVLETLKERHGSLYTESNVMMSGTHTHSTPGGYLQDLLFDLTSLGFVRETFESLVAGIALSIQRAHNKMRHGRLFLASGELLDVSVNRSPTAYLNNPEAERRQYKHNTDKTMVLLKFVDDERKPMGAICWYAVHATSMNYTNKMISSDNLGFASITFEQRMNPRSHPGKGDFVAAFASSNEGDSSPNIRGPWCLKSGRPCDAHTSTCATPRDLCVSFGPGRNMFESTRIIGTRLFDKAWELWGAEGTELKGPVQSVHQYVDMPKQQTTVADPKTGNPHRVHGCLPAMGYSFAAGTTDGPGASTFRQGTTSDNPLWNAFRDMLSAPADQDIECHAPKPILLPTGAMNFPFEWQPRIVSTQLARVGPLAVVCAPGEFTTMSGRRMRTAIQESFVANGVSEDTKVVVAGLCNTYSDYITTFEEYQVQRYEGASTIFGPHTLELYLNHYRRMAEALLNGDSVSPGPNPPELMNDLVSLQTPVIYDSPKWGHEFGDVLVQPKKSARPFDDVRAVFVGANPRNNIRHGATYLTVERLEGSRWVIVATDANWETKFMWERVSTILGTSEVTVVWTVPQGATPGTHRLRYFGDYKYVFGGVFPFVGVTDNFTVAGSGPRSQNYGSRRRIRAMT